MKILASCIGCLLLIAALNSYATSLSMEPGKWEVTTKFVSADLPPEVTARMSEKVNARSMMQCLKKARDFRTLPSPLANGKIKCEQTDFSVDAERMTWLMTCAGGSKGTVTVFSPNSDNFVATMELATPHGKGSFVIEGKRTAETCDAK